MHTYRQSSTPKEMKRTVSWRCNANELLINTAGDSEGNNKGFIYEVNNKTTVNSPIIMKQCNKDDSLANTNCR
jgi:hypothetical protein